MVGLGKKEKGFMDMGNRMVFVGREVYKGTKL